MPNLNDWIEAQLKRGYTRKQIKALLIRKGYPQTAVAEVDKVGYSALPAKTLPSNKIPKKFSYKAIALIGLTAVIVIGIVYFMDGYQRVESPTTTGEIQTTAEIQTGDAQPVIDICNEFPPRENEISCEEAINIALAKYPAEIKSVNRDIVSIEDKQMKASTKEAWILTVHLANPINSPKGDIYDAEIAIDAIEKDVLYLRAGEFG